MARWREARRRETVSGLAAGAVCCGVCRVAGLGWRRAKLEAAFRARGLVILPRQEGFREPLCHQVSGGEKVESVFRPLTRLCRYPPFSGARESAGERRSGGSGISVTLPARGLRPHARSPVGIMLLRNLIVCR